jgi:hypothetical protein
MSASWTQGLTLDRIDNNKGYEPENCRWATPSQQARNTRRSKITPEVLDLAKKNGVKDSTLRYRLTNGWPQALAATVEPKLSNRLETYLTADQGIVLQSELEKDIPS